MSKRNNNKPNQNTNRKPRNNNRGNGNHNPKQPENNVAPETEQVQPSTSGENARFSGDPALARDAASIPFSWVTGTTNDLRREEDTRFVTYQNQSVQAASEKFTAPGILVEWLQPSIGYTADQTSPINVAATSIYSYIRHANSGSANYDANDLAIYLMAIGDIIAYVNFLIRAYGLAGLVSSRNRYLPKALLQAQNINADSIIGNLAQFRYSLNYALNKLSSFAVPKDFEYFARKKFIFSRLYHEGTSIKDQMYLYAPSGFLEATTDSDSAGALAYAPYHTVSMGSQPRYSADELISRLNRMIDKLFYSEDYNIMSGDILKAYGLDGILKYERVDPDYIVAPEFEISVLEQMKNATVVPEFEEASGLNYAIQQDPTKSFLISKLSTIKLASTNQVTSPQFAGLTLLDSSRILTTTTAEVSPELILTSSRLMAGFEIGTDESGFVAKLYSGFEVCTDATVVYFNETTEDESDFTSFSLKTITIAFIDGLDGYVEKSYESLFNQLKHRGVVESFQFAPQTWHFQVTRTEAGNTVKLTVNRVARFVSFDNYAVITRENLRVMHEACLLGMMKVPSIGNSYQA